MNNDKRLNMNIPSHENYSQEIKSKVIELENEYNADDMEEIIAWLSCIVLEHIEKLDLNHCSKPDSIPERFIKSTQEIEIVFINLNSIINTNEPESIFLCKLIGKKIADLTSKQFEVWEEIYKLIEEQYNLCDSWIKNLPIEIIEKNKKQLYFLPRYNHPLELVSTWGNLREKEYWNSFSDNDFNNKRKSKDIWEYVDLSIDYNNEFLLGNELRFKCDLLQRLGLKEWTLWVTGLPIIHIKNAAISEIKSLDDAEKMIKILLELKDNDNEKVQETIVLVIQHIMDLYKRINNNLEHYSSDTWVYSDEEKEYSTECKKQLVSWENQELPTHLKLLAEMLINEEVGKRIIIYMLRHLYVGDKKDFILIKIRDELINSLASHNVPVEETIEQIMKENTNKKTVLNSLLLIFNYEDLKVQTKQGIFGRFWEYYYVILNDKFYWQVPLYENNDDLLFLWAMAGVLANFKEPIVKLKDLIDKVYYPSEGWNYDSERHYSSRSKLIHCLIVGAMATEWLTFSKANKLSTKKVFDFVWEYAHKWLRDITTHYPDEVDELLIQLWARLPLIYGDKAKNKVIKTVKMMDDLSQILLCNKVMIRNCSKNDEDIGLDEDIKKLLKEKFDEMFPIYKLYNAFDKNKVEWLIKTIKEDLKVNVDI